jgi:hypothetical protein
MYLADSSSLVRSWGLYLAMMSEQKLSTAKAHIPGYCGVMSTVVVVVVIRAAGVDLQ